MHLSTMPSRFPSRPQNTRVQGGSPGVAGPSLCWAFCAKQRLRNDFPFCKEFLRDAPLSDRSVVESLMDPFSEERKPPSWFQDLDHVRRGLQQEL